MFASNCTDLEGQGGKPSLPRASENPCDLPMKRTGNLRQQDRQRALNRLIVHDQDEVNEMRRLIPGEALIDLIFPSKQELPFVGDPRSR